MLPVLRKLLLDEEAKGSAEYGLVIAVMAVAVIIVVIQLRIYLEAMINKIRSGLVSN